MDVVAATTFRVPLSTTAHLRNDSDSDPRRRVFCCDGECSEEPRTHDARVLQPLGGQRRRTPGSSDASRCRDAAGDPAVLPPDILPGRCSAASRRGHLPDWQRPKEEAPTTSRWQPRSRRKAHQDRPRLRRLCELMPPRPLSDCGVFADESPAIEEDPLRHSAERRQRRAADLRTLQAVQH